MDMGVKSKLPTIQMDSVNEALDSMSPQERKKNVTMIALKSGLQAAATVAAVSIPAVLLLNRYNPRFQTMLGVSGKTATAFMPPLFTMALVSEQVSSRLANPEAYTRYFKRQQEKSSMPFYKRAALYVHDRPFHTVAYLGIPAVAGIFILKGRDTHFTLSQRLMNTRVLGQFSVIVICMMTLATYDIVERLHWEDEREIKH